VAVTVSYQDLSGAAKKLRLDGFQARIFQHEFDHLQGVLFHDRMAPDVLATVQPQLKALEEDWDRKQRNRKAFNARR
jgi:peptide deformylase